MGYLNGKDALPPELLKQVQRYAEGTCVYIPRSGKKKKEADRAAAEQLCRRNEEICRKYADGRSVRRLAGEYFLSTQAIYKILAADKKRRGDGV